jgi:hypothetical protein
MEDGNLDARVLSILTFNGYTSNPLVPLGGEGIITFES